MTMIYSIEPRNRIYVKGYGFLSLAENMGKSLSDKYGQKRLESAKKSAKDATKTAEATGDLIGNKIAEKVTTASKKKSAQQYNNGIPKNGKFVKR